MRVRFEFLPTWDEFERRKWQLADKASDDAEAQVLLGLKRTKAVTEVEVNLRNAGKPHQPDDMEKWYAQGKVKNMSAKVISTMLKINVRFEAAGREAFLIVGELDSKYSIHHSMASTSNLDLLCQRTSCRKNEPLQGTLLLWCLHTLKSDIFAGKIPAEISISSLKIVLNRYLLRKRVVSFLGRKFQAPGQEGVQYDGEDKHPSRVVAHVFACYSNFVASGLAMNLAISLAWMGKLPEFQSKVLEFGAKVVRGTADMDKLMDSALERDNMMSAEAGGNK
jgi:hypothetical protein